jgi:hypothetical protein
MQGLHSTSPFYGYRHDTIVDVHHLNLIGRTFQPLLHFHRSVRVVLGAHDVLTGNGEREGTQGAREGTHHDSGGSRHDRPHQWGNDHGPNHGRSGIGENPVGSDDGRKQEQGEKIRQAARRLWPSMKSLSSNVGR